MNRSPVLAGVLSVLFPGLGHLYARATARGLALAAAAIALVQAELALPALAVWAFGIWNAIQTTEEQVRAPAEGRSADVSLDRRWAAGLIAAGVIASLAMIPGISWTVRLWPLVLVWIGFQLLRGRPVIPGVSEPGSGGSASAPGPPEPPPGPPPPAAPLPARATGDTPLVPPPEEPERTTGAEESQ